MTTKLKVTLTKSTIGVGARQQATVRGLGLRKPHDERVLENTPAVRGMIKRVLHLVDVAEIEVND
ncbi:MAG: 50S ribosomal protein L30 [Alphaproteobacteria bacterium]|nr:50S ribosomal protein L30 [Alphaproteobacteria bacterium]